MKEKEDKAWLILPMLAYTKHADGTHEISFGWLTRTWWIKFSKNQEKDYN
jgi:hypothetical protein